MNRGVSEEGVELADFQGRAATAAAEAEAAEEAAAAAALAAEEAAVKQGAIEQAKARIEEIDDVVPEFFRQARVFSDLDSDDAALKRLAPEEIKHYFLWKISLALHTAKGSLGLGMLKMPAIKGHMATIHFMGALAGHLLADKHAEAKALIGESFPGAGRKGVSLERLRGLYLNDPRLLAGGGGAGAGAAAAASAAPSPASE